MGQPIARVGDTVVGFCNGPGHDPGLPCTGVFTTGSPIVSSDGLPVIRIGDIGVTSCGHTFVASTGSSIVSADGISVHRVGDICLTEGNGVCTTVSGSDIVSSN